MCPAFTVERGECSQGHLLGFGKLAGVDIGAGRGVHQAQMIGRRGEPRFEHCDRVLDAALFEERAREPVRGSHTPSRITGGLLIEGGRTAAVGGSRGAVQQLGDDQCSKRRLGLIFRPKTRSAERGEPGAPVAGLRVPPGDHVSPRGEVRRRSAREPLEHVLGLARSSEREQELCRSDDQGFVRENLRFGCGARVLEGITDRALPVGEHALDQIGPGFVDRRRILIRAHVFDERECFAGVSLEQADDLRARNLRRRRFLVCAVQCCECSFGPVGACLDAGQQRDRLGCAGARVDDFLDVGTRLHPLTACHGGRGSSKEERIGLLRILGRPFGFGVGGTRVAFGKERVDFRDSLVGIVLLRRLRENRFGLLQLVEVTSEAGCGEKPSSYRVVWIVSKKCQRAVDDIGARVADDFVERRGQTRIVNPAEDRVDDQEEDQRGDPGRDEAPDASLERFGRRQDDFVHRRNRRCGVLDLK